MRAAPETKISKLRAAWAAGDKTGALRIAARFHDRSAETKAFQRAANAVNNPGFYRQLGRDPDELREAAYDAMAKKFGLER